MQNGVWQLQKITLRYSRSREHSRGAREFVENSLESFKKQNPQIEVTTVETPHSVKVTGYYLNGAKRPIVVRNPTAQDVSDKFTFLRNQCGMKARDPCLRVYTNRRSIQGVWQPDVDYASSK
ncbi:60S ribosomal protein L51, mitochondrial isoform 2 [Planoprotostelium fungivorum]|uniref:Large ribosomal subunit protein mL43 n=1 Tax=Planoprotostelium fungivorum TaxID=1890364 RepID=A0A2P6N643_9EUKA|nr:60S ribosomal protein L51, mitochondrial isoform 2 [Planoprotostelium fungivorum]